MSNQSNLNDRNPDVSMTAIQLGSNARGSSIDPFNQTHPSSGMQVNPGISSDQRPLSLSMFTRFKKTIVIVALLIAVPSIAGIWMMVTPLYRVSAQVHVRPIIPRLVFTMEDNGIIPLYQSFLNTQVSVILSPTVIQRVLDQPDIRQTQWYNKKTFAKGSLSPIDRLWSTVDVRPRGMTEVIDITLSDPNGQEAALIINAILDQYLRFVRESASQADDIIYQGLLEQYHALRNEIEGREMIVAEHRKDLRTGVPETLLLQRRTRIDEMEATREELRRQIDLVQWQQKEMEALQERVVTNDPEAQPQQTHNRRYEEDAEWRRLYMDFRTVQHQIEVATDQLGDSHPTMVQMRKRLVMTEELLHSRETLLDEQLLANPGMSLASGDVRTTMQKELTYMEYHKGLLQYQEKLLLEDIDRHQRDFAQIFDTAQMMAKETEAIAYRREIYEAVRNRIDQKEVERNVPGSIDILARAMAPSRPTTDRRVFLSVAALFGGIAAGFAVAFLRASTSQMITEADDLPAVVKTPFLGQLPLLRSGQCDLTEGLPEHSECIRMVRTALLQRMDSQHGNAIMITSAGSKTGKTTVAMMLAKSLTQCGKKVLLVDADLRNPSLSDRFGIDSEPGLLMTLMNEAEDKNAIVQTDTPGLSVLPAGKQWNRPDQELLANGAFTACLERWRRRYDIILFDAPPILPVADARIISRQMNGTIMVVREGHCRRSEITESLAFLGTSGGKLIGTVFIGSSRSGGYHSPYYDNYYGDRNNQANLEIKQPQE